MKRILLLLLPLVIPFAAAAQGDTPCDNPFRGAADTTQRPLPAVTDSRDGLVLRPQGSQLLLEVAGYGIVLGDRDPNERGLVAADRRNKRTSMSFLFSDIELGFNVLTGID